MQTSESYKKGKIKHEKQKILDIVDKGKLWGLNLMEEQYQVITLGLPFMSQLVSVRGAFHNKMVDVRKDSDWTSIKKAKANDAASTRNSGTRNKNLKSLCHCRTYGATGKWEKRLEGILTTQSVFLLQTLFAEVKNILPNKDNLVLQTLRLLVTDAQGWETPHFVEDYQIKGKEHWGWSFHLSLCEEGTFLSLWKDEINMIEKVHIPFGCALVTRSDVCRVGLGNSQGNMMLQGNLFAQPMGGNHRDMPTIATIQPEQWALMTADASIKRSKIMTRNNNLIRDETLATQVGSIATQLSNSYTFQDDFLDCMKMK